MGVTKTTHQEGTGPQPQVGQTVTIEYTGFLKDSAKADNKGKQCALPLTPPDCQRIPVKLTLHPHPHRFDSSVGRGDFVTKIGVGQVIKGKWSVALMRLRCLQICWDPFRKADKYYPAQAGMRALPR